jgi:hypothetical protein
MDPAPKKKSASGRKMRVATAFTGAVALAATCTPVAADAAIHRDPRHHVTRIGHAAFSSGHSTSGTSGIRGYYPKCPFASSVHIATSTKGSRPNAKSICVSPFSLGSTIKLPGTADYFAACGGSFSGYYSGISKSGTGARFKDTFRKGKTFWAFPHNGPIKSLAVHVSKDYATYTEKC